MRLLVLLVALLLPLSVLAQDGIGSIAGRVMDATTGEPLPGANVIVEGTQHGAATGLDGTYRVIDIPVGRYTVTARFVGYETQEAEIVIRPGYTATVHFDLDAREFIEFTVCGSCWGAPLIQRDPFARLVLMGEDIARLPVER